MLVRGNILSILIIIWWIWIIKLHLWYFVTFGVAYDYVPFRPCTKPLRNVDHVTFDVPFSRTDVFKNSFFVRIRRLWNELLLSITESNTLSIFAKNLMAFYYDKFNVNFLLFYIVLYSIICPFIVIFYWIFIFYLMSSVVF